MVLAAAVEESCPRCVVGGVSCDHWLVSSAEQTAGEAAATRRRVLAAVERSEPEANDGRAVARLRQIEGAAVGLETISVTPDSGGDEHPMSGGPKWV